jgi:acyl-CoA thioester hydrolase
MADSPVTYRGTVYPWQCDHVGHMNVMWYVGKFDEATWSFLALAGITGAHMRERGTGMAAVQQNIAYRRELMPGDTVFVRTRPLEARGKVVRFRHEMVHDDSGEVAASCELTVVHMDRARRKSAPLPEAALARLRGMLAQAEGAGG